MEMKLLFKLFLFHLLLRLSKGDDGIQYGNNFLSYGDIRAPFHNNANPHQFTPSDELLDLFRNHISSSELSANVKYDLQVLYDLIMIMNSVHEKRSIDWINEFVRRVRFIFWKYGTYDEFRSSYHFPDMHGFAVPFELRIIEYTYFLRDAYKRLSSKELPMMLDENVENSSATSSYYRQPRSSSHTPSIENKGSDEKISDNSSSSSNDRINYAETEDLLLLGARNTPLSAQYKVNSAGVNRLNITKAPFVPTSDTTSIHRKIDDNNDTVSISGETIDYMMTNLTENISDNTTQPTNFLEDSSDYLRANFPEVDDTGFYDVLVKRSIKTEENQEFLSEKFVKSHPIVKFNFQPVTLNDDILKDLSEFFKLQLQNFEYSYLPNGYLKSYTKEVFDVLKKLTKRIDENADLMYNWIMYEQTIKNVEQMMRRWSFNETLKNSLPAHLQKYVVEAIHSDKNATSLLLDNYYNQFVRNDCGILSPSRTKRVINGNNTSNDDWPWIVYIKVYPKKQTSDIPTDCVGVLIADQFVLSAAHCFNGLNLNCDLTLSCQVKSYEIVAFFGLTNSSQVYYNQHTLTKRKVLSIDFHENYLHGNQFENDLVILKLKKPIELNEEATAVCLPSYNDNFYGMDGYVAGWGVTSRDERIQVRGDRVDGLQEAMVPIIPHSLCEKWLKKSFQHFDNIQEFKLVGVLCAGYEDGWADACKGDSGGPLVVESPDGVRTLAGIVSNGFGCGLPLRPGMYVDVARQAPWIKYKMAVLS